MSFSVLLITSNSDLTKKIFDSLCNILKKRFISNLAIETITPDNASSKYCENSKYYNLVIIDQTTTSSNQFGLVRSGEGDPHIFYLDKTCLKEIDYSLSELFRENKLDDLLREILAPSNVSTVTSSASPTSTSSTSPHSLSSSSSMRPTEENSNPDMPAINNFFLENLGGLAALKQIGIDVLYPISEENGSSLDEKNKKIECKSQSASNPKLSSSKSAIFSGNVASTEKSGSDNIKVASVETSSLEQKEEVGCLAGLWNAIKCRCCC